MCNIEKHIEEFSKKTECKNCNTIRSLKRYCETDRNKEFYKNSLQNFLNKKNIEHCSRNCLLGAVFAERFNCIIRDLRKRPVFEKGDCNWLDILPTRTKKYNKRKPSFTKITPIQASLKKNEGFVYRNN